MGTLLNIANHTASRAPMVQLDRATITTESGVENDFRGRPGDRQVTVLVREAWETACTDLGIELPWTTRRANLLVEGLDLNQSAGSRLHVGNVVLEITGETEPCGRMEEARPGLLNALTPDWRAGVTCRVLQSGAVQPGDPVRLEHPSA
ncbi:MAG: MOSC domain-containing protein [bacterium]|nr:MOSC domain-containing protein [bacterium]